MTTVGRAKLGSPRIASPSVGQRAAFERGIDLIARLILQGDLTVRVCDMNMQDGKVQKKTSESESVNAFGRLLLQVGQRESLEDVALKIWMGEDRCPALAGLRYEVQMYKLVTKFLSPYTPCIVPFIAHGKCSISSVNDKLDKDSEYVLRNFIHAFKSKTVCNVAKNILLEVLVTEKVHCAANCKFYEWNDAAVRSPQDLFAMIFMILYTLEVMIEKGVQHNDLHLGNILVKRLDTPRLYVFVIDQHNSFAIQTRYLPMMFDWDRGYATKLGPNKILDIDGLCEAHGECSSFNPKYDAYTFLSALAREKGSHLNQVREFVNRQIAPSLLNKKTGSTDYLHPDPKAIGKKSYLPSQQEMKHVVTMLNDPVFKNYFLVTTKDLLSIGEGNLYTLPSVNRALYIRTVRKYLNPGLYTSPKTRKSPGLYDLLHG